MLHKFKRGRVAAALSIACACALIGTQVPASAAGTPTIGERLSLVGSSAAGINAEVQFAKFATSPQVASAAQFLLSTQASNLTGFQRSLLSLASDISQDSQAIRDRAAGKVLSGAEQTALTRLRAKIAFNPAIRVIEQSGQNLKHSPGLPGTVASDATGMTTPVTIIPPGSGVPQVDSFDGATGQFSTNANLPALAPRIAPIMRDKNFPDFVKQLPPLVAASLLPAQQIWKLLLPNDHDPSVADWVDFLGGVLSLTILGVAGIVAVAAPAAVVAIVTLIVVGTTVGIGTLTYHFLTTIDCDHDGDPWDAADVVGNEC